jgi:hypothetical protein
VVDGRRAAASSISGVAPLIAPKYNRYKAGYGKNSKAPAFARDPGGDREVLTLGRDPTKLATFVSHRTAFKMRQIIQVPELDFTKS